MVFFRTYDKDDVKETQTSWSVRLTVSFVRYADELWATNRSKALKVVPGENGPENIEERTRVREGRIGESGVKKWK